MKKNVEKCNTTAYYRPTPSSSAMRKSVRKGGGCYSKIDFTQIHTITRPNYPEEPEHQWPSIFNFSGSRIQGDENGIRIVDPKDGHTQSIYFDCNQYEEDEVYGRRRLIIKVPKYPSQDAWRKAELRKLISSGGAAKSVRRIHKPTRKIHTGPRGGKYYIKGGKKVYM